MEGHIPDILSAPPQYLIERLRAELDPARRIPLYEQLEQLLIREIQGGRLPAGTALPPEPELAEKLGLSRSTVNQALVRLARRGLVTRRRPAGTVVAEPFVEQPLGTLYSFLRTLTAQGRLASTRILGRRITLDAQASPLLVGRADGLVVELTRLRLVDAEPFATETIYLPLSYGEALPDDRLATEPLYDLLRDICGVDVTRAEETLRPVTLEIPDAVLLGLSTGDPAFLVERVGFSGERVVELRRSLIRGDRYRFRVELQGPALT